MTRLWDTEGAIDPRVLAYTVGDDPTLDLALVPYDCAASIVHAERLAQARLLSKTELADLTRALREIARDHAAGRFSITPEEEDCHTAIENRLTARLGETGKKIHTGRSRNDQVLVCLRLLTKERLIQAARSALALIRLLTRAADRYADIVMPGYSHTRQAMPTTAGHLFASWAEALVEDFELLDAAYRLNDRSPLGAAAGFGVPLPLDRRRAAKRLGFAEVQRNTLNAVSSRAKIQWAALAAMSGFMQTLARMAADVIAFSDDERRFLVLSPAVATGSSIMPQKRNPDVFELLRANAQRVAACTEVVRACVAGLPSGYHRDVQTTKAPLLDGLRLTVASLDVARVAIQGVRVDAGACRAALTDGIFAADQAYDLVRRGVPFREAYRAAKHEATERPADPMQSIRARRTPGDPGDPAISMIDFDAGLLAREWNSRARRFRNAMTKLLEGA